MLNYQLIPSILLCVVTQPLWRQTGRRGCRQGPRGLVGLAFSITAFAAKEPKIFVRGFHAKDLQIDISILEAS